MYLTLILLQARDYGLNTSANQLTRCDILHFQNRNKQQCCAVLQSRAQESDKDENTWLSQQRNFLLSADIWGRL